MKIDEKKLDALHAYFLAKGSTAPEAVLKQLGTEDEEEMDAYIDALRQKYPKTYPKKEKLPVEEPYTVILTNEDGIGHELEIVGIKGKRIYVKEKIPTEIVTVKLHGKDVDVDILKLRKMKSTEQYLGVSVQTLLVIAQAARGE